MKENCRMNKTLEYKSSQMISMLIEQLGVIFRKWSKDQWKLYSRKNVTLIKCKLRQIVNMLLSLDKSFDTHWSLTNYHEFIFKFYL